MNAETTKDPNRPFPIQSTVLAPGGWIPWWLAEIAYAAYSSAYGASQSLERLAERGGFGWSELGLLLDNRDQQTDRVRKALQEAWKAKPWEPAPVPRGATP